MYRKINILITLLILVTGCVTQQRFDTLEENHHRHVESSKEKLKNLSGQINNLENELLDCKKKSSALELDKRRLETDNLHQNNQIDNLKDLLADSEQKLHRKETIIKTQKKVIAQVNETKKKIEHSLKKQIASQEIKLEEMEGKLKLTFVDKILFNSGSASINKAGKEALLHIADSLRDQTQNYNIIRVEGHTDNIPIADGPMKKVFQSNWELSAARAISVVRFLRYSGGIDPTRMCISAYSLYRPVDTNDTAEGRKQNRRIEIILTP